MRLLVKPIRLSEWSSAEQRGAKRGHAPSPRRVTRSGRLSTPLADELSALIVDELSAPMFEQQGDSGRAHR